MLKPLAFAVATAITAVSGMLATAPASHAAGYGYDGTDPARGTGCANGSVPIWSRPLIANNGQRVGTLELRYSSTCGTNWMRLDNWVTGAGSIAMKSIQRKDAPSYWETENDRASGWSYSMQVYAPGATCVWVGGAIVGGPGSGVGVIASIPETKVC